MKKKLVIAIAAFVLIPGLGLFSQTNKNYLVRCNEKLVEVVMEDLFNPPVSSRVYVYPNIAAYEVLCLGNPQLRSLSG
ncbi:MAG TPA: phosphatidic acid phosphatase, partial [Bacteroidia bacterium]|nr:phosphatidic acid phosphatase [Bacteroidia bacterium]